MWNRNEFPPFASRNVRTLPLGPALSGAGSFVADEDPGLITRSHHRQRWTADDDAVLVRMFAAGAYTQDVARALGRSQEAVRTRAEALGISVRSAPRRPAPRMHA